MRLKSHLWKIVLVPILCAIVLLGMACGTIEVGIEATSEPIKVTNDTGQEGSKTASATPDLSKATEQSTAISLTRIPTNNNSDESQANTEINHIVGIAAQIDHVTGWITIIPESKEPFGVENQDIAVRISEWASITELDGSIYPRERLSRGVELDLEATMVDGELVSESVIVLSPGVPPIEENPAYTDVSDIVTPIPPQADRKEGAIQIFEVTDGPRDPGDAVQLTWDFSGFSGTICSNRVPRPMTQTCYWDLPPTGTMEVTIPLDAREFIQYTLFVQLEELVESSAQSVQLTEGLNCTYEWFFEHESPLECPAEELIPIRLQAQLFERGMMLRVVDSWLGADPYLLALIVDDALDGYGLTEGPLLDTWTTDLPEQIIAETPPDPLFAPSRGFGLLWSGQIDIPELGPPRIFDGSEALGWATGPVFEFDTRYQCGGEYFGNRICWLELPDDQISGLPGRAR